MAVNTVQTKNHRHSINSLGSDVIGGFDVKRRGTSM